MTYPSRIDLSMHSLQKRCRHSITVLVFLMIPVHKKKGKLMLSFSYISEMSGEVKGAIQLKKKKKEADKAYKLIACILNVILCQQTILLSETFWVLPQSLLVKDEQVNDAVAKSTKKNSTF